mgnify:CR=1 FL=1
MDSPIYHLEGVVKAKTEDMEDFVGPLDLILHLLSKNKMEIKDIQISLILDQYLAWMAARKEMDLEVASEFVTMASQLVYIKTRMLLSIHDEEALSEMEQLIATMNPNLDMNLMVDRMEQDQDGVRVEDADQFHILVADDSLSIRTIITRTLERAGYRVTKASSGKEAWDILEDLRRRSNDTGVPLHSLLDVVISDIEMPEMDGHALTRKIKGDPVLKQLPVVLFSSLITDTMRHRGREAGADYQISKPDLPNLTKQVRSIITEAHGK